MTSVVSAAGCLFRARRTFFVLSTGAVLSGLLMSGQAAFAEGFPGIGDRVRYAESLPHYNLGNRYLQKEWYEKAVEKYNDAIRIYPYDADVYTNLGIALRKMDNYQAAESAYRQAVKLSEKDWVNWSNLANLLMIQDRFPESLQCFQKALKCNLPAQEKEAIEKNIIGIKKIMKNRAIMSGAKSKPVARASTRKKVARAAARRQAGQSVARQPVHMAGDGQSLDSGSYEDWIAGPAER